MKRSMIENRFPQRSPKHHFLTARFRISLFGPSFIGLRMGKEIESPIVHRLGGVTALYIESFNVPHLQQLAQVQDNSGRHRAYQR